VEFRERYRRMPVFQGNGLRVTGVHHAMVFARPCAQT
jgi:hypothetical protein